MRRCKWRRSSLTSAADSRSSPWYRPPNINRNHFTLIHQTCNYDTTPRSFSYHFSFLFPTTGHGFAIHTAVSYNISTPALFCWSTAHCTSFHLVLSCHANRGRMQICQKFYALPCNSRNASSSSSSTVRATLAFFPFFRSGALSGSDSGSSTGSDPRVGPSSSASE